MQRKIAIIATVILASLAIVLSAQSPLKSLKKGGKLLKHATEQVSSSSKNTSDISVATTESSTESTTSTTKSTSTAASSTKTTTQNKSNQKKRSGRSSKSTRKDYSEPALDVYPPSASSTTLLEPLGYKRSCGTLSTASTLPGNTRALQQKWMMTQPSPWRLSNKRLVDELKSLESWRKTTKVLTDDVLRRIEYLNDELELRLETLQNYVEAYKNAQYDEGVDWLNRSHIVELAEIIGGDTYYAIVQSSLTPFKSYLEYRKPKIAEFFAQHGGYDNTASSPRTKWNPFGRDITMPTSADGVVGTPTVGGMIAIQGAFYWLNTQTGEARVESTCSDEVGRHPNFVIPDSITSANGNVYIVTDIRNGAFYGNGMKTLKLPNTLKRIGGNSFANLPYVTTIDIPNSVTELALACFHDSPLLEEVHIGNSVTTIGGGCFTNCPKLRAVTFPKEVIKLDQDQFRDCSSLVSVTLPENITEIRAHMFQNCTSLREIVIPNSVKVIAEYAFAGCKSLTNITFSSSLTTIESSAFEGVPITKLTLPSSTETVSGEAFKNCKKLTAVVVTSPIIQIEWGAFEGCSLLKSVTLPKSCDEDAFLYRAFSESGVIKRDALIDRSYFHFVD